MHYDFNEVFNFTYDYINNDANASKTFLADNYTLAVTLNAIYDTAVYDTDVYGQLTFEGIDFLLRSYYYFSYVSWGCITRAPNEPFGYIGGSLYFRDKGILL